VEYKERVEKSKLLENAELETLLDEYSCHTQLELAESLRVAKSVILLRLEALGIIQKQRN